MTRKSWRDICLVHPAADVFPMMTEEELKDLGKDIKKNGLRHKVVIWSEVTGFGQDDDVPPEKRQPYLLDGRNRLDAMELVGLRTVSSEGYLAVPTERVSAKRFTATTTLGGKVEKSDFESRTGEVPDPTAYVISANIKRRHLTKKQQADLIVKAVGSAKTDFAKMARSVKRSTKGRVRGSTKDPVKSKVLEEAEKNDISKRTAERALAEHRATTTKAKPRRRYVACPECSARVADLDHHLRIKHKRKANEHRAEPALSQATVHQLEDALMKAKEVAAECKVCKVLTDKAALKKILALCDEIEAAIALIRGRVKNRPSDKEIGRVLSIPLGASTGKLDHVS